MRLPDTIRLQSFQDVERAKQVARLYASSIGFSDLSSSEVVLGVSEIASNAVRHADKGQAHYSIIASGRGLRIRITDEGTGIHNVSLALKDGYSTIDHSLGIGMGVSQRAFDYFKIHSLPTGGTEVKLEKYLPISKSVLNYGYVSIKDQNYELNGDQVTVLEYNGDSLLAAVIDGAGQGLPAHNIAECVSSVIKRVYRDTLQNIIIDCDDALSLSDHHGGATITLLRIEQNQLEMLGVGDTHTYMMYDGRIKPLLHSCGRIGVDNLPKLRTKTLTLQKKTKLICCTDGIKSLPSNFRQHPLNSARNQAIQIFNNYHRPYGDATALVINYYGQHV